jgi:tetratricopeptide (TPR) repeat protein
MGTRRKNWRALLDPVGWFNRFDGLMRKIGRAFRAPTDWIFGLSSFSRRFFNKLSFVPRYFEKIAFGTATWMRVWLLIRPLRLLNRTVLAAFRKTILFRVLNKVVGWAYRSTIAEPFKWLVLIAGVILTWGKSRRWASALLFCIPSVLWIGLGVTSWLAGRVNKLKLASQYIEISEKEFDNWQESLSGIADGSASTTMDTANRWSYLVGLDVRNQRQETLKADEIAEQYQSMLFRRVQVLDPTDRGILLAGYRMMQRGATDQGIALLTKIAPNNEPGDPRAHAMLASAYYDRLRSTTDETLIPIFQHHAENGARWQNIPQQVLLSSGDLLLRLGQRDRAITFFQRAAHRNPDLFPEFVRRCLAADQKSLAEFSRDIGIVHFTRALEREPNNKSIRFALVELLCGTEEQLLKAEQLLKEGAANSNDPNIARAMSEVYRMRFVLHRDSGKDRQTGLTYLDKAIGFDPSNPNVAAEIADAMQAEAKLVQTNEKGDSATDIGKHLNSVLASAKATTGTHAILAEYHLSRKQYQAAILHLEQIVWVAPTAARYANELAVAYAREKRFDEASRIANHALSMLQTKNQLNERYVDDLVDTLGKLYQKQKQNDQAISMYEYALTLNAGRIDTRERLIGIYEQTGMPDKASAHRQALELIKQKTQQYVAYDRWLDTLSEKLSDSVTLQPLRLPATAPSESMTAQDKLTEVKNPTSSDTPNK